MPSLKKEKAAINNKDLQNVNIALVPSVSAYEKSADLQSRPRDRVHISPGKRVVLVVYLLVSLAFNLCMRE